MSQDDITTLMLKEYEHMNAGRGGDYEMLLSGVQEIERLRKENQELLQIAKLFADNGKCQQYEDEFGYCAHSPCDWHGAEHLWESFCMSRGI